MTPCSKERKKVGLCSQQSDQLKFPLGAYKNSVTFLSQELVTSAFIQNNFKLNEAIKCNYTGKVKNKNKNMPK